MVKTISICNRKIGKGERTFIIAEAGINHNGDINIAKKLIHEAKKAGADAIKFQTYITENRVPKDNPVYSILKKSELNKEQINVLKEFAEQEDIIFFSSPFDEESVDVLLDLKVPLIKITSMHVTHLRLLRKVAKTKTPVIMSRGMASVNDMDKAIEIFEKYGCPYILMHCVSSYPMKEEDANISIVRTMIERYKCPIGYSDHSKGIKVPLIAIAGGANIIEKHFTHDKKYDCADQILSSDPMELKKLVDEARKIETILGKPDIRLLDCEKGTVQYKFKSK
ncbi:acetylneuraminic acid synthetase [Candidatus Woesearchaeota archaeon B3_Woes]|nr:MAG: acetylneuraminic acid synthetase [Candidatus Woesearchaeota archaeon B3_Woes]